MRYTRRCWHIYSPKTQIEGRRRRMGREWGKNGKGGGEGGDELKSYFKATS